MFFDITSTVAKVTDVAGLNNILDDFEITNAEFRIDDNSQLQVLAANATENYSSGIPQAMRLSDLPARETFPTYEAKLDAMYEAFPDHGDQGFLHLLLQVAQFLTMPLTILAANQEEDAQSRARVWIVRPGAVEIETLAIDLTD